MNDESTQTGLIVVELFSEDGSLKWRETVKNLITDIGDAYYAAKAIAGISPANASAPTPVTGMKLGTGTTSVAKSGAGAALVTYISGSNLGFASTYPQTANLGAGAGVNAVYRCSWGAGVATANAIAEVVIVNDSSTDATSTAANTIARGLMTPFDKAAGDSLVITWNHKNLGV